MEIIRRGIVAAMLLLAAIAPGAWGAEGQHKEPSQVVESTGEAAVMSGDMQAAERAARQDAMRKAIEQVIGAYVSARSRTENSALIEDRILTKAGGFATIKRVISKGPDGDVYKFTAEVVVSAVPVVQLLRQNGLLREWRVMVIIPEWHIQRPIPDPAAETEFINQFVKAGYKVIDQKRYAELRQQNAERLRDPAVAAEIGRKMGADVVITGEAFSQMADANIQGSGLVSCRARVEVRAILADTAEIVSADAMAGAGADLTEAVAAKTALQNTARKLAPQFVNDITLLPASDTRNIQLEVSVFKSFSQATKFERAIAALSGVTKVSRESYDEGVLVLNVESDAASAEELAEQMEAAESMQPFGLRVGAVSKTRIRATVK